MRLTSPKKILAIKLRSLGDTVLMTAALTELRRAYPQAKIHVLVTSRWAAILENHPAIDHIWPFERHPEKAARAKAVARTALKLRHEKYDWVINFHASPSSALIAFGCGARERSIHFHGHKDKNRYSTVLVPGKGELKPIIERDIDAIRALGTHVQAGIMPSLFLLPKEREEFQPTPSGSRILALGLGASRPTKTWPLRRFAETAVRWCTEGTENLNQVVALVGQDEPHLRQNFLRALEDALSLLAPEKRSALKDRISIASSLSIRKMAALLSQTAVFLGNDSGPKHVAAAVGTPTVTLFGPEHPFEWHPYPRDRHPYFFIEHLACRKDHFPGMPEWCSVFQCIEETHPCMIQISVDEVCQTLQKIAHQETRIKP
ncbi:glycosyltransferase family 9 protein [Bdellovibrionota bacterium FG-2]